MFTQRCSIILFILFTLLRIICGIWYGKATTSPVPYVAAVKEDVSIGFNLCGAAIISPKLLLTHAPCLYKLRGKVVVVAGVVDVTHPGIISEIKDVIPHEDYDPENGTNPLALVRTVSKIIGNHSKSINITNKPWAKYDKCKIAGYGFRVYKEENVWFRNITIGVLHTNEVSGLHYNETKCGCLEMEQSEITDLELICTLEGQSGVCIGDFGAPLVCDTSEGSVVVAIAANFQACKDYDIYSAYMSEFRQFPCGHKLSTEMYTFVYPYVKWIQEQTKKTKTVPVLFSSANSLISLPPLSLLVCIRTINYIITVIT